MDRLAELQAENTAILARAKVMLAEYPGSSWGTTHQAEWNANMHRMTQIDSEIASLTNADKPTAPALKNGGPVPRGIVSVQAEADPSDIAGLVEGVNAAFGEFKTKQDTRVAAIEQTLDGLTANATAAQMNGTSPAALREMAAPVIGPKAMHNYGEFKAHFASKDDSTEQVSVTEFLRGVAGMQTTAAVHAALSVGTNNAGGYSVPAKTMPLILGALSSVSSLMLAGAGIVPMDEGAKSVTTAVVDKVPTASWRLERGAVVESDPVFRGVLAAPQSLAFYFKVSRELLADGQGIEAALQIAIGQAFAQALDYAGLRGSGTAPEPRGIRNTEGVTQLTYTPNGETPPNYSCFLNGIEAMLNANAPMPTASIMAPRTLIQLSGLTDTTNQPLRKPELLATLPMIATPQIPTNLVVGTRKNNTEIYLGDFTKMYFLMRESLSIQLLREAFATTGEIGFLCHVRADVVITHPAAFVVVNDVHP
ncbi:phage major capsid protein [Janthinobacterium sp. PAMC25594]|uniref:phage major capsid protein n=1 Tax=Janthinobacterium sp. PAMC25594 TaxID=2861284 RepID=UPI001C62CDA2|nr:phage major capsid protein [Janthinobacterium sp. PAMC25594]QYG05763.1 phage major capsid protein [Janthinobacterium sp. PAMC25594]